MDFSYNSSSFVLLFNNVKNNWTETVVQYDVLIYNDFLILGRNCDCRLKRGSEHFICSGVYVVFYDCVMFIM